jgi:hypothetical protein
MDTALKTTSKILFNTLSNTIVFDGVVSYTDDCSDIDIGEVLVGAGKYMGGSLSISAVSSLNLCSFGGDAFAGYIEGNPIKFNLQKHLHQKNTN